MDLGSRSLIDMEARDGDTVVEGRESTAQDTQGMDSLVLSFLKSLIISNVKKENEKSRL